MLLSIALSCLQAEPQSATFNRTVAPILWQHCATCHRPGEVGPFSLLTYAGSLFWSLVGGVVYIGLKKKQHLEEVTEAKNAVENA